MFFYLALYALERRILSLFLDRNLHKIVYFWSNHCVTGSNEHEILIYMFNLKSPARELFYFLEFIYQAALNKLNKLNNAEQSKKFFLKS